MCGWSVEGEATEVVAGVSGCVPVGEYLDWASVGVLAWTDVVGAGTGVGEASVVEEV